MAPSSKQKQSRWPHVCEDVGLKHFLRLLLPGKLVGPGRLMLDGSEKILILDFSGFVWHCPSAIVLLFAKCEASR